MKTSVRPSGPAPDTDTAGHQRRPASQNTVTRLKLALLDEYSALALDEDRGCDPYNMGGAARPMDNWAGRKSKRD